MKNLFQPCNVLYSDVCATKHHLCFQQMPTQIMHYEMTMTKQTELRKN